MSYDIYLVNPITKEPLKLESPHFMRGGTYCLTGDTEAHLNITYNYAQQYRKVFGDSVKLSDWDKMFGGGETGIRKLYGMSGADSIPILENAINQLKDDVSKDYWKSTEGNAKAALLQLLALAKLRPDGIWKGD